MGGLFGADPLEETKAKHDPKRVLDTEATVQVTAVSVRTPLTPTSVAQTMKKLEDKEKAAKEMNSGFGTHPNEDQTPTDPLQSTQQQPKTPTAKKAKSGSKIAALQETMGGALNPLAMVPGAKRPSPPPSASSSSSSPTGLAGGSGSLFDQLDGDALPDFSGDKSSGDLSDPLSDEGPPPPLFGSQGPSGSMGGGLSSFSEADNVPKPSKKLVHTTKSRPMNSGRRLPSRVKRTTSHADSSATGPLSTGSSDDFFAPKQMPSKDKEKGKEKEKETSDESSSPSLLGFLGFKSSGGAAPAPRKASQPTKEPNEESESSSSLPRPSPSRELSSGDPLGLSLGADSPRLLSSGGGSPDSASSESSREPTETSEPAAPKRIILDKDKQIGASLASQIASIRSAQLKSSPGGPKPAPRSRPQGQVNADDLIASLSSGSSVLDGPTKMPSFGMSSGSASGSSIFGDDSSSLFGSSSSEGGGKSSTAPSRGPKLALFEDPLPSSTPVTPAPQEEPKKEKKSKKGLGGGLDIFADPLAKKEEPKVKKPKAKKTPPPDIFADPLGGKSIF